MHNSHIRIYWANALFTEADREFNSHYAGRLRKEGFDVFLPQESVANKGTAPTARDIFKSDTVEILNSDLLVACLDQETIDSGVACEVGIAYTYGIPIIGLYTDIRQYRQGDGHMYKNLYVIGAIELAGTIVRNMDELLLAVQRFLPNAIKEETTKQDLSMAILQHYGTFASKYRDFVKQLEGWYQPSWDAKVAIDEWLKYLHPRYILEVGCGTGDIGRYICAHYPVTTYVGYDPSPEMITIAQSNSQAQNMIYTTDLHGSFKTDLPFDLAIASFTLHDHPDKEGSISALVRYIRPGGHILIIDLSTYDLPNLTRRLRYGLARPMVSYDPRINLVQLSQIATKLKLSLVECKLVLTSVSFPSVEELDLYMDVFGIYLGMDLPLGLSSLDHLETRANVRKLLGDWDFPFTDQRGFITCILKK